MEELSGLVGNIPVQPRFTLSVCRSLHSHVVQLVKDQLGKRGLQPSDVILRTNIKFLTSAAGLAEVRLFVAEKFEQWVQNSKMVKQVQELLSTVAINSHQNTPEDVRVLETLLNVKLKTRFFSQNYVSCIKEFVSVHQSYISIVLRRVVNNELSQTVRQPTNIQVLTSIVQQYPEESMKVLGSVFQDFLCRKEDFLRALRGFLRELVRRCEGFPFSVFARSLMQQRSEPEYSALDQPHKERMATSLADLISVTCLLSVSASIRELYSSYNKGDKTHSQSLAQFFDTLGLIQRDAVWWVHSILPNFLRPQPSDYKACLRKVLFLEPHDSYCGKDNWPPETERGAILQLMTECSLKGDTLMRILVIGLDRDLPLSPSDALDITDKLVARAANVHTNDIPRVPSLDKRELFDAIFDITAYRPPSSIMLPKSYKPPDLAISKLYWKGWLLLLVLAAFNPKTIGSIAWSEYPMLQAMMIMVMTNEYSHSLTIAKSNREASSLQEEKIVQEEKEVILTYENHLAVSSSSTETEVTESNSYLLNQVMLLDPRGPARKLPSSALELIKTVNGSLRLGQLLCQCRQPDFLLEIIQQQGTSKAMSWLRDLIDGSHSSLDVLPVPCLCEFLITSYQEKRSLGSSAKHDGSDADGAGSHRTHFKRRQRTKEKVHYQHDQIIGRLRSLIFSSSNPESVLDILEYFISKLTSSSSSQLALKSLQDILLPNSPPGGSMDIKSEERPSSSWLLNHIPSLSVFPTISTQLVSSVLKACCHELNTHLFMSYLLFITTHSPRDNRLPLIGTELAVLLSRRFPFFKKAYQSAQSPLQLLLSLLDLFQITLEAAVKQDFQPPSSYPEADLVILSLPSLSDDCEIVVVTQFVDAVFLVLSLMPPGSPLTSPGESLFNALLPDSEQGRPAQALSMGTREPQQLAKGHVLETLFINPNTDLTRRLISTLNEKQVCHLLSLYGVPLVNMDLVLYTLDQMCDNDDFVLYPDVKSLLGQVRRQHIRGCTSGHKFLSYLATRQQKQQHPKYSSTTSSVSINKRTQDEEVPMSVCPTTATVSLLSIEEAVSIVFESPDDPRSGPAAQRLVLYLLSLLRDDHYLDAKGTDSSVLGLIINKMSSISPSSLDPVFKQSYSWNLFHLIARSLLKLSPTLTKAYLESSLSIIKATGSGSKPRQILGSCVALLTPQPLNIPSFSFNKGSHASKSPGIVIQPGHDLEETLLPFARYSILNGSQDHFIDSLLKLRARVPSVKGLLCDIAELMDPELVLVSPLMHVSLFSQSEDVVYLLEKFLHHVSLATLQATLVKALSTPPEKDVSSSLLLNLLWASLHLPNLWQGKVKKEAIIDSNLCMGIEEIHQLELSTNQLHNIVEHILKEMSQSHDNGRSHCSLLSSTYLPLLVTCSRNKTRMVARYISEHSSSHAPYLLLLLYYGDPSVSSFLNHSIYSEPSSFSLPSKMDSYLHYLLTAMTNVSSEIDSNVRRMTAASLLCRQISVAHPLLILRHLPLLGCLLKGRTHLNSRKFSSQHQIVFNNIFHLLHLLRPLIFSKSADLESCLESFMSYLKNQCLSASVPHSLFNKVLSFLTEYCQQSRDQARKFLSSHSETLESLRDAFPKQKKVLQEILNVLPSKSKGSFVREKSLEIEGTPPVSSLLTQSHSYTQVLPFLRKLEYGQTQEDVLQVLKDLEDSSLRSIDILHHFIPVLCRVIQSSDISCVKIAHEIILRYLRHDPSSLPDILPSIMASLNSPNYLISMTAIPYIGEIILLSSGKEASQLLSCLFHYAVASPVNCGQELKQVVSSLTLHIAV
ncbi:PREDICTED: integrator complex subunit 1-like [Amphimedon queenslandica]|uniref:DUF3677 domain-containing protein n=1 Tax=Amphimedon queenslandica TaxID=400682 RepID=A0AAN0JAZ5_AMPQE|nr:PREDICTED: integrator complex subunit 1-like [Amphimedon queenslandica]|eukprot:XP_019853906.1 PREDICTED: integrator complex subunit 1-like [Amphimedon queenslandica]